MIQLVHFTTVHTMADLGGLWTFIPHNTSICVGESCELALLFIQVTRTSNISFVPLSFDLVGSLMFWSWCCDLSLCKVSLCQFSCYSTIQSQAFESWYSNLLPHVKLVEYCIHDGRPWCCGLTIKPFFVVAPTDTVKLLIMMTNNGGPNVVLCGMPPLHVHLRMFDYQSWLSAVVESERQLAISVGS